MYPYIYFFFFFLSLFSYFSFFLFIFVIFLSFILIIFSIFLRLPRAAYLRLPRAAYLRLPGFRSALPRRLVRARPMQPRHYWSAPSWQCSARCPALGTAPSHAVVDAPPAANPPQADAALPYVRRCSVPHGRTATGLLEPMCSPRSTWRLEALHLVSSCCRYGQVAFSCDFCKK